MSLSEILPTLQAPPRDDKLRLVQFLVNDPAREEGVGPIEAGTQYPIWPPHEAFDAAAVLLRDLEAQKGKS